VFTTLEIDLNPTKLVVLPVATTETSETTAVSDQVFAGDFATRDQSEVIPSAYRWRRCESKTLDFAPIRATTGNHGKPDAELAATKDGEKHVPETALPTGKIEHETMPGRAGVGDMLTAETLGTLARRTAATGTSEEGIAIVAAGFEPVDPTISTSLLHVTV